MSEVSFTSDPLQFLQKLKQIHPEATMLTSFEVIRPRQKTKPPTLHVIYPEDKLKTFLANHSCSSDCVCAVKFTNDKLLYTPEEQYDIELGTRGQHTNENWHKFRKQFLTASNFKKIIHSTNFDSTAVSLYSGSNLNEDNLPSPIAYGRKFEDKARKLFIQSHNLSSKEHNKCKISTTGLIVSKFDSFLACSPDGILSCPDRQALIEIKCIFSQRKFKPLLAGKNAGIIDENADGTYSLSKKHAYYYQVQGQMGVTNIHKCILILFTDRGINTIDIFFDPSFWTECKTQLSKFYNDAYFPLLKQNTK